MSYSPVGRLHHIGTMEANMRSGVQIATPKTVKMTKQTDNANNLLPEVKKRKRKENSSSKTKIIPKQENTEVPSLMSAISVIGDSILKRKKRTIVRRRRLSEMTEPMRRLANATRHIFLPPKDTNEKPNIRAFTPPIEDKNELIIRPKVENDPTKHPNDDTDTKGRRGRPSKHQFAASGSRGIGHTGPKQGSDRKTSLVGRVHHGVDQRGGTHQTPLDKNEPKQLGPRPQPRQLFPSPLLEPPQPRPQPPPPQPWPAMSPTWLQSEPYIQPFTNVGSSSNNGPDYKGKQVVVDDESDKRKKPSFENDLDFLFANPNGGIKINGGSNKNTTTDKESIITPVDREFINELCEPNKSPIIPSVKNGSIKSNPKKTGILQANRRKNVKSKMHAYPSTYLRPAARKSGGSRRSTGGAMQSAPLNQGMQPPPPLLPWGGKSRLIHDFMTKVPDPPQPPPRGGRRRWAVPDSHNKEIQRCAEAIYGKEAFANGVPPFVGPFTAIMNFALNPKEWPPKLGFNTTATGSHRFLPPHPPSTTSGHDELELASTCNGNPETYDRFQPPPLPPPPPPHITPPQHHQAPPPDHHQEPPPQIVTNPFLYNNNLFQQQNNMFVPPPMLPPQMTVFGVANFPGSSGDGNQVMGNWGHQGPPPQGI